MNYLLDTHVFLWVAAEPENLSSEAEKCIMNADNALYLSIVSPMGNANQISTWQTVPRYAR
jgi:PIN domain nuclease of toxin-antitoxin system